jgi:PST family polysaccharide transporter
VIKEKFLKIINIKSQPLFVNMASLGLLQLANYAIPIIIIPFIVRALGVDFFGKTSYAQNIISYLTIIVNFGFEYSATQDIAIHKDDKNKLKTIFWTVLRFKTILLILSFVALGVLYFVFSKVHEDGLLYLYAALINIGFVLFPTWFFQGIEKMAKMAMFNFTIKALGAILIVLMIHAPADYRLYLLLLSLSYVAVGILSLIYVIKKYELTSSTPQDKHLSQKVIKKGFPIFLNNLFGTLYTAAGLTILGFYVSDKDLGIYAGAYKIIMAVMMLTSMPINIALFPVMSRKFNDSIHDGWIFFKSCLWKIGIFAFFISVCVFLFAPLIVHLFLGHEFQASIPLLQIFSILPFLVIIASLFTVQGLYGLQLQKFAPFVGGLVGTFCIIINFILIPKFGLLGAAIGYISSEVIEIALVSLILLANKKKIESK